MTKLCKDNNANKIYIGGVGISINVNSMDEYMQMDSKTKAHILSVYLSTFRKEKSMREYPTRTVVCSYVFYVYICVYMYLCIYILTWNTHISIYL